MKKIKGIFLAHPKKILMALATIAALYLKPELGTALMEIAGTIGDAIAASETPTE